MLSRSRGGFPAEVVELSLHAPWGSRNLKFRYELVDKQLNYKRTLTNVREEGNSISFNALGDIKRTAKFSLVDDGSIDFLGDRIKPYVLVEIPPGPILRQWAYFSPWQITESVLRQTPEEGGWVEFPCGVFLLSTPELSEDDAGTLIRDVEAYDQTVILKNDKVDGKYLIPQGTLFTTAIKTVLESAGITRHNIAPSAKVLPSDREWEVGTDKLTIINDLLKAMNYYSIWFDEEGWAIGSPYVLPANAPSEYVYSDDYRSVIARPVTRKLDVFDVPNKWVFYTSEPSGVSLKSIYVNNSAGSPLSTVNRGMTITDVRQVEAADQATLDSLVQRAYHDTLSQYEVVTWSSWLLPYHSHMDNYTFAYSGMGISAKYRETSWSMDLRADGIMNHECRKSIAT